MNETEELNEEYHILIPDDINDYIHTPVAPLYSKLRATVIRDFDTSFTFAEINSPEIKKTKLNPIIRHLRRLNNPATVFCCLLNYWDFLRESESEVGHSDMFITRATVCEILAIEILSSYGRNFDRLIQVLTHEFNPLQGLTDSEDDENGEGQNGFISGFNVMEWPILAKRFSSALGIAIRAKAKRFTASPLVQIAVQKIWSGDIVFYSKQIDSDTFYCTQQNASSLSSDDQAVLNAKIGYHTFLPERFGGMFRASRLRVPVYQNFMNIVFFCIFIILYSLVLQENDVYFDWKEKVLLLMTIAYTLDEIKQFINHGISFYFQNIWNYLDVLIYSSLLTYFYLRYISYNDPAKEVVHQEAHNLISCIAVILWPRLLMILDGYPFFGMLIITLKRMFMDATLFFTMAIVIFIGFFQSFCALAPPDDPRYEPYQIFMLMLRIFFGSSYIGFDAAYDFGPLFGPAIMYLYISLTALFLMTILMSIFNQSFSAVSSNAAQEHLFNFTVKVMEFVESESLFPFIPPFNLVQIFIISPLYPFLPARAYAFLNRSLIRILFAPFLVLIYSYENLYINRVGHVKANVLISPSRTPLHRTFTLASANSGPSVTFDESSPQQTQTPLSRATLTSQLNSLLHNNLTGIHLPKAAPLPPTHPQTPVVLQLAALENKYNRIEKKLDSILKILEKSEETL